MNAHIERPDGTFEIKEMGNPICGQDFCDTCGDCLACYRDYCFGGCKWVIYLNDPKNKYYKEIK